jgi:hypothetical protein
MHIKLGGTVLQHAVQCRAPLKTQFPHGFLKRPKISCEVPGFCSSVADDSVFSSDMTRYHITTTKKGETFEIF